MKIIFLISVVLLSYNVFAQEDHELLDLMKAVTNTDWSCLAPKVPYPCAQPAPGIYLRYWEPAAMVVTQKRANAWQGVGASQLQYHDVHVYDFPTKLPEQLIACPSLPNVTGGIHYRSEMDSLWRSDKEKEVLQTALDSLFPLGNWGPLHPRIGFMVAVSSAVTSAVMSLRAVSIASMEPPWVGHQIIAPLDFMFNRAIDKLQMLYPFKSSCMLAGTDALWWAPQFESAKGKYVWIVWHYRECCKPVVVP